MAWRCGSLSRSLISTARTSTVRSTTSSLPRLRPPLHGHRPQSRRLLSSLTRTTGVVGCCESLLPLHSVVAATRLTSHIAVQARAWCELSQASFEELNKLQRNGGREEIAFGIAETLLKNSRPQNACEKSASNLTAKMKNHVGTIC
ncbi:unnamed protein product [Camellia sinensis]|uniref:uncharacterized protein LOC114310201 n=1 Tax=Camellia sinensis TaxID=4442 RepID=UPI001035CC9E|nr:uncharacterized protein LOC114310201 [Camellia sinensis]